MKSVTKYNEDLLIGLEAKYNELRVQEIETRNRILKLKEFMKVCDDLSEEGAKNQIVKLSVKDDLDKNWSGKRKPLEEVKNIKGVL